MTNEDAEIEFLAMNIVHQTGDALYEALPSDIAHKYFVNARQATNDIAIDFAYKLIARKTVERAIEELENLSMAVVEPCEPDCDSARHAHHQGTWDAHIKIDERIAELESELHKLDGEQ